MPTLLALEPMQTTCHAGSRSWTSLYRKSKIILRQQKRRNLHFKLIGKKIEKLNERN